MSSDHVPMAHLETAQWVLCEPLLRDFESAWQVGRRPAIRDFLPSDQRVRLPVLFELVLTDIEFRLADNQRPRVESYLDEFPDLGSSNELLTNLVVGEWELRRVRESLLQPSEFIERFPHLANAIQAKFDTWASRPHFESQGESYLSSPTGDKKPLVRQSSFAGFEISRCWGVEAWESSTKLVKRIWIEGWR